MKNALSQSAEPPVFAAVLLAGGRSSRMGQDKALLALPDGQLLWQRQLAVLRTLQPSELFIAGPRRADYPPDVRPLEDQEPGLGPLSGLAAALQAMRASHLVVLAIDLPAMTAAYLGALAADATSTAGVVPKHPGTGFYEPLAAVYPAGCRDLAARLLQGPDRSLHTFVRAAGALIQPRLILPGEEAFFQNWNTPADVLTETTPAA